MVGDHRARGYWDDTKFKHIAPGVWRHKGVWQGAPCLEGTRIRTGMIYSRLQWHGDLTAVYKEYSGRATRGQIDLAIHFEQSFRRRLWRLWWHLRHRFSMAVFGRVVHYPQDASWMLDGFYWSNRQYGQSPCQTCVHYQAFSLGSDGLGGNCAAFPVFEIPHDIWLGKTDHTRPVPGDHGILYRRETEEEREQRFAEHQERMHTRWLKEIAEGRTFPEPLLQQLRNAGRLP